MTREQLKKTFPTMSDIIDEVYDRSVETGAVEYDTYYFPVEIDFGDGEVWHRDINPIGYAGDVGREYSVSTVFIDDSSTQTDFNQRVRDAAIVTTLQAKSQIADDLNAKRNGIIEAFFGKSLVIETSYHDQPLDYEEAKDIANMAHTLTKGYINAPVR